MKFANFVYICITRGKSYHFLSRNCRENGNFFPRVIQIHTRFANFARLYFPYFTTFRHQTSQFYMQAFLFHRGLTQISPFILLYRCLKNDPIEIISKFLNRSYLNVRACTRGNLVKLYFDREIMMLHSVLG